jgi:hypothetical protein
MTLAEDFSAFTDTLSTAEQETLGASLLLAVSALCLADDEATIAELLATGRGAALGAERLGPGFEELIDWGKIGIDQACLDLKRQCLEDLHRSKGGLPEARPGILTGYGDAIHIAAPHVASGQALVARMPPSIREPFEDFVARWLLHVAEASGGFLWWGEKISPAERDAARQLLSALGIVVRDPVIRQKFAIDG